MRVSPLQIAVILLVGILIGYFIKPSTPFEGFQGTLPLCPGCGKSAPCSDHPTEYGQCPKCPDYPDMSKYVLKSSIPPCPSAPDMSQYMLKTECPPVPDLSQYVLKSSVPKPQPIIVDSSACKGQCGACPPCPRPRCPEVKCPPPTVCPTCPPCPRMECPATQVKCRSEPANPSTVRPYLAPLSSSFFGSS